MRYLIINARQPAHKAFFSPCSQPSSGVGIASVRAKRDITAIERRASEPLQKALQPKPSTDAAAHRLQLWIRAYTRAERIN
jgi:hypothetical protein